MQTLTRLYPAGGSTAELRGVYLNEAIAQQAGRHGVFLYANFVTSLDGRIALKGAEASFMPKGLSNPNDFRLFLELQAQADCLVTHSGYLRELSGNTLGNVLQVGIQESHEDLAAWRLTQGLKPQPDIVIVSSSLDFPDPRPFLQPQQQVTIIAGAGAASHRVKGWRERGHDVVQLDKQSQVDASALLAVLQQQSRRNAYMVAGPQLLDSLMRQRLLDRLYLTHRLRLLGGEAFHSLIPGAALEAHGTLALRSLWLDPGQQDECGQLFASYAP